MQSRIKSCNHGVKLPLSSYLFRTVALYQTASSYSSNVPAKKAQHESLNEKLLVGPVGNQTNLVYCFSNGHLNRRPNETFIRW